MGAAAASSGEKNMDAMTLIRRLHEAPLVGERAAADSMRIVERGATSAPLFHRTKFPLEVASLESFSAGGLKVRWRAPVGWGFSSPVVAQGRVFLANSDVVKPTAKERVHCWDETSGKPLWTHTYDVAFEDWGVPPVDASSPGP